LKGSAISLSYRPCYQAHYAGGMKVIVFGATGMLGRGVLRECLTDPRVEEVLVMGRSSVKLLDPKLREVLVPDLADLSAVADELSGYDACFFCLGVTSAGLDEATYTRLTYDLTVAAAEAVARRNDRPTFAYLSGAGTDSTERGRVMWARVKGRTENALLAMPLKAFMFRPGIIQARHGERPRGRAYRVFYAAMTPLMPVLRRLMPDQMTTTEAIGRAMINIAAAGWPTAILNPSDINAAAQRA
jgi:uncharacterized protein YbjT (DUF2867 family)